MSTLNFGASYGFCSYCKFWAENLIEVIPGNDLLDDVFVEHFWGVDKHTENVWDDYLR